jgi:hypothetical protein
MKKKISALARAKTEAALRTYGFNAAADDLFFVRIVGGLVQRKRDPRINTTLFAV